MKDSGLIIRFKVVTRSHDDNANRQEELLPTRRSLLDRLRDWEDQAGWREFFDTYWKFIYSMAVRSGLSDQEAEDVVQETVTSVARRCRSFTMSRSVVLSKAG